jgi:hypothetical protein
MLHDFQLTAIISKGTSSQLRRIPLVQQLQTTLAKNWKAQFDAFTKDVTEIEFDAAYKPDDDERFVIRDFTLPNWIAGLSSSSVDDLETINNDEETLREIKSIVAFTRIGKKNTVLFQNFVRSRVIQPGRFLWLEKDTYQTADQPGFALDARLSAVYEPDERKLLFSMFRTVNSFLPLMDVYAEASEQEIRDVLAHEKLAPANVPAMATESNQWFRKHFALLGNSRVLDDFSPQQIKAHAKGYRVQIQVEDGKIVFPENKKEARKLLQFLTEELFKGAITDTLYETNSKRVAT